MRPFALIAVLGVSLAAVPPAIAQFPADELRQYTNTLVCYMLGVDDTLRDRFAQLGREDWPLGDTYRGLVRQFQPGGTVYGTIESAAGGLAGVWYVVSGAIVFILQTGDAVLAVTRALTAAVGQLVVTTVEGVKCLVTGVVNTTWNSYGQPHWNCWWYGNPGWNWLYHEVLPWYPNLLPRSLFPPCL